jgi:hypothetical protein
VVADVQIPIIGVDLFAYFGLLIERRSNHLLDGTTTLCTPGRIAHTSIPSLKTTGCSVPADNLLAEFPELIRPSGSQREVRHNTLHHIRTTPGPPVTCRPRRLAPDRVAIAKAEFDAMLLEGTARSSESSWSSTLHLVPKKDNGWRPCCDCRAPNARTVPDRYTVQHIHDYAHHLFGCTTFSKADVVRVYNQIPVHPADIEKTNIITPFGLFEFPFVAFALRNAGQTFQRFMDDIRLDLDFCFAYFVDILVFSRSPEVYEQHL